MLKVSFCGRPMSVIRRQHLPCGLSRGHISLLNPAEFGQNVCLDKISDEFELGPLVSETRSLGQIE